MKKCLSLLVAIGFFYAASTQEPAKLETLLNAYSKIHKFNGAILVAKKDSILINKGYGYRNAGDKVLNDAQTIFQIGSITKQFTTAVILKLQQEKKLRVQDKLSKYFPGYPKGDSITIENLMLHTSGIYNYTNDENFMKNEITKPASRAKMMALFKDKPLDFSPGSSWNYSNSAYLLLGYIIETVTKKPYEAVVRNYIFSPLKMTQSGFDFAHLKTKEKATGYFTLNEDDTVTAPIVDSTVSFSAGAIYSTVGDLYKWHKGLENYSILTKEQQEKSYTAIKHNYGYGWDIDSVSGKKKVGHGGGIPGFITNISRVPEDDICIVLLSNASDGTLQEITGKILDILYSKPYELPEVRTTLFLSEEKLQEYTGEYEIRPNLHVVLSVQDGKLQALPTGQSAEFIYAEKEDFFFSKLMDLQLEFKRNDKKEVDSFILHQNGNKIVCKKIK